MERLGRFSQAVAALAFGCRQCTPTARCRHLLRGVRSVRHECRQVLSRQKAGLQQCRPLAIKLLRVVSRLKLLQTGITLIVLPPVFYLYFQGQEVCGYDVPGSV
ncbi:transmembrane protein 186 [Arapaima gigas]